GFGALSRMEDIMDQIIKGNYSLRVHLRKKDILRPFSQKLNKVLDILEQNPFEPHPPYEKLVGDLAGAYSRRINIQHRVVYQVLKKERIVKVLRLWTHYE
nr:Txe/YoeB family addiction module toxin [Nitrospiraceae bacterium]